MTERVARQAPAHPVLAGLFVYPVKSCRGVAVDAWALDDFGLVHDRRYMLVRPDGSFLTQRELPRMALIDTALDGAGLILSFAGQAELRVVPPDPAGPSLEVVVWKDRVRGVLVGDAADRWLGEVLGVSARLVHFPDTGRRPVDARYAAGAITGFADGFPLLLVGQASLDDLNARLAAPVPMDRFRPNLVIAGSPAFAEDGWQALRIGRVDLRVVKPCARCVIVTTDQTSAVRGAEPLRTLATYRRVDQEVMFGQNAVHLSQGVLRLGDPVVVG